MESSEIAVRSDAVGGLISPCMDLESLVRDLPATKRAEIAEVASYRRVDLAADVAQRSVRLQSSNADMEQILRRADELSRMRGDFLLRSHHQTASGTAELTVCSHTVWNYVALAALLVALVLKLF